MLPLFGVCSFSFPFPPLCFVWRQKLSKLQLCQSLPNVTWLKEKLHCLASQRISSRCHFKYIRAATTDYFHFCILFLGLSKFLFCLWNDTMFTRLLWSVHDLKIINLQWYNAEKESNSSNLKGGTAESAYFLLIETWRYLHNPCHLILLTH